MKQLSPTDSFLIFNEQPRQPLHAGSLMIYDPSTAPGGRVRFKDILAHIESRLHLSPFFRRKLVRVPLDMDEPYWVDDKSFDLEFHVRHIALPKPGDWRQLCILISRMHSRPLDLSRPPWEYYVIEGLDNIDGLPKGCFAMYQRTHHAAMDGATGIQTIDALHDKSPAIEDRGSALWQPEDDPTQLNLLTKAYVNLWKKPSKVVGAIKKAATVVKTSRQNADLQKDSAEGPLQPIRFNQKLGPHRAFTGVRIDLQRVKAIKNSVEGTTINDVVLALMGGALRTYLSSTDELPDQSLIAGVPINVRSEEQKTLDGGNVISVMTIPLHSDISDPLERLKAIHKNTVERKSYVGAAGADLMISTAEALPAALLSLGVRAASSAQLFSRFATAHTVVTNVPGAQKPLYLCGSRLVTLYGIGCPMDGVGLFNTVMSYNGYMTITVTTDRDKMPDPDFYQQCITDSLAELEDSVRQLTSTADTEVSC